MKKVIIASTNPVKIDPTQHAFTKAFPGETFEFLGTSAKSGVSDQPMTDTETLQGAINRVEHIAELHPDADYWVGVEGGIDPRPNKTVAAFAWAVVKSPNQIGQGKTGEFFLPPAILSLIKEGRTLGEADDAIFSRLNSGQENGTVGLLTNDLISRADFHEQAIILALIPFLHDDLYR